MPQQQTPTSCLSYCSFFPPHFISNTFHIILAVPSKQSFCNASIVKSKFNFSIHFSKYLLLLLMPLLLQVQLLPSSFSKFLQFHTSTHYNLRIFSSFFSVQVSNGNAGSISRHFLLFLSITVISGRLCSRLLSVSIGKSHKILQSSDSKPFSGLSMYHFSALLNHHFSHSFQWIISATLSCLTYMYSCASFEHSETICTTVSSAVPHARQMNWTFSP